MVGWLGIRSFEPKAEERHLRLYVRPVESEFNDLKSKLYLCKDSELVSCPQMYPLAV